MQQEGFILQQITRFFLCHLTLFYQASEEKKTLLSLPTANKSKRKLTVAHLSKMDCHQRIVCISLATENCFRMKTRTNNSSGLALRFESLVALIFTSTTKYTNKMTNFTRNIKVPNLTVRGVMGYNPY